MQNDGKEEAERETEQERKRKQETETNEQRLILRLPITLFKTIDPIMLEASSISCT